MLIVKILMIIIITSIYWIKLTMFWHYFKNITYINTHNPPKIVWGRYYYYWHFSGEETEAQRGYVQLVCCKGGFKPRQSVSRVHVLKPLRISHRTIYCKEVWSGNQETWILILFLQLVSSPMICTRLFTGPKSPHMQNWKVQGSLIWGYESFKSRLIILASVPCPLNFCFNA